MKKEEDFVPDWGGTTDDDHDERVNNQRQDRSRGSCSSHAVRNDAEEGAAEREEAELEEWCMDEFDDEAMYHVQENTETVAGPVDNKVVAKRKNQKILAGGNAMTSIQSGSTGGLPPAVAENDGTAYTASMPAGNFMMATWYVDCKATKWEQLGAKMISAPFDIIVIMLSPSVRDDSVLNPLSRLSKYQRNQCTNSLSELELQICMEKAVISTKSDDGVFWCVHRAKVLSVTPRIFCLAEGQASEISFSAVAVALRARTHRMQLINIACIRMPHDTIVSTRTIEDIADTIDYQAIAAVTGYFGKNTAAVAAIGSKANAILDSPFFQPFLLGRYEDEDDSEKQLVIFPVYTIAFGFYSKCRIPDLNEALTAPNFDDWADVTASNRSRGTRRALHNEFLSDMLLADIYKIPSWPFNDRGSSHVPHLGKITMKQIDWAQWIPGVFQLPLWMGQSLASARNRDRHAAKRFGRKNRR